MARFVKSDPDDPSSGRDLLAAREAAGVDISGAARMLDMSASELCALEGGVFIFENFEDKIRSINVFQKKRGLVNVKKGGANVNA